MQAYIKLIQAKHSEVCDDIADYDGNNTELLNYYVVETTAWGDFVYSDDIGTVSIEHVNTVTVIGADFETRCYTNKARAYRDSKGQLWMHEQDFETVFC